MAVLSPDHQEFPLVDILPRMLLDNVYVVNVGFPGGIRMVSVSRSGGPVPTGPVPSAIGTYRQSAVNDPIHSRR